MTKAMNWLLRGEDRLVELIDKKKSKEDIRRGSVRKGRIIRNTNGTIRRVRIGG